MSIVGLSLHRVWLSIFAALLWLSLFRPVCTQGLHQLSRLSLWACSFNLPPLQGHRFSDPHICATSTFPAIHVRRLLPAFLLTSSHDSGRLKGRKVLQPQTGSLNLAVPKLPRLNDLIGLSEMTTDLTNWIFYAHPRNPAVHQLVDEAKRLQLLFFSTFPPARPARRQISTRRMSDHQIPFHFDEGKSENIAAKMKLAAVLGWEDIAGPSVMSSTSKCPPNYARELAGNKNIQTLGHIYFRAVCLCVIKAHANTLAISRAYVRRFPIMASTKEASRSSGNNSKSLKVLIVLLLMSQL